MTYLIIIILIVLNGYFSLAEIALISVKDGELTDEEHKKNQNAFLVQKLVKDPEEFLSAVQVGITLLGLLEGIYGGDLVAAQLEPVFKSMGFSAIAAHISSLVLGIGVITYLTIVFGELLPKFIALQIPLKISLAIAPSLNIFSKLVYPFIWLLTISTQAILSTLSIKNSNQKNITKGDLKRMMGTAYKQGSLDKHQLRLHENVFNFEKLTAKRIMKPARITICMDYNWTLEQVVDQIRQRPYSYFPVYRDNPTNIIGILNIKTFFLKESEQWQRKIIPGCKIASTMPVKKIFEIFSQNKLDFGLVNDAHNTFIGVVAMQDIMEGIFGDIPEREDYSKYFFKQSDKVWMAEGFIHLQRIRHTLNLPWIRAYEYKYTSVAELVAGEHPYSRERKELVLKNVTFRITEGTKQDAVKIQIMLP